MIIWSIRSYCSSVPLRPNVQVEPFEYTINILKQFTAPISTKYSSLGLTDYTLITPSRSLKNIVRFDFTIEVGTSRAFDNKTHFLFIIFT